VQGSHRAGAQPARPPAFLAEQAPEVPPPFAIEPAGFPLVWVEAIDAWMHWLPVTKAQFERFLAATSEVPAGAGAAAWYGHLLAMNPPVAPARVHADNYRHALLTGLVPREAQRFAAWLGPGFAVPTLDEWLRAWSVLAALPADHGLPAALARRLAEPARTLVLRLENALAAAADPPRRRRTLADQMLLRGGVLEWVEQDGRPPRWVGIGEPPRLARALPVSPERGPVAPEQPEAFRSYLFGCRLICRPASGMNLAMICL
jgi:hypothetical protein